jgi:hypothetical protein
MRFFSNDARESAEPDDSGQDPQADDRPETVQSDPVAVPAQRPPSPWSNAPADDTVNGHDTNLPSYQETASASYGTVTPPPAEAERWAADDSVATTYESDASRNERGAHAADPDADAVDLPLDDSEEKARDTTSPHDTVSDTTTSDDTVSDRTTAEDTVSDRTHGDDAVRSDTAEHDTVVDGSTTEDDAVVDGSTTENDVKEDSLADDTVADEVARDDSVRSEADQEATVPDATTDDETKAALKDEGGFDDPKAVDPATDETLDSPAGETLRDGTPDPDTAPELDEPIVAAAPDATAGPENPPASDYAPTSEESTPVVAAVPVAAAAAAPAAATFFDAGDAQAYKERWRDVQLRFVDSPKEAADEAATLVSEAVEKLTASLNAQKDGLADETDDTERLRVQIRGYRDILNRILAL